MATDSVWERPTPGYNELEAQYAGALSVIRGYLPLHATRLEDFASRVTVALQRFRAVRKEELDRKEAHEAYVSARLQAIEERIEGLRNRLDASREENLERIDIQRREWEQARLEAARVYAMAGVALPGARDEDLIDLDEAFSTNHGSSDELGIESAQDANNATDSQLSTGASGFKGIVRRIWSPREQPNASSAEQIPAATSQAELHDTEPYPVPSVTPYDPRAEAESQTPSLSAIASEIGLPYPSAAMHYHEAPMPKRMRRVGLWALGAIFGVSVGVITGFIKMDYLSHVSEKWPVVLSFAVLGIPVFWVFGSVGAMLASMAAEDFTVDAVVDRYVEKVRRFATKTLIALAIITLVFLGIEICVEYHGVIGGMAREAWKTSVRRTAGPALNIHPFVLICVVSVVSAPFLLLHIVEGWLSTRAAVIKNHLDGIRERRLSERMDVLRAEHMVSSAREKTPGVGKAQALTLHQSGDGVSTPEACSARVGEHGDEGGRVRANAIPSGGSRMENPACLTEHVPPAAAVAEPYAEPAHTVAREGSGAPENRIDLALARERVYQASRTLRETRARALETERRIQQRIDELKADQMSLIDTVETDTIANRRLEDAWADFRGAAQEFDEQYAIVAKYLECVTRPGWPKRLLYFIVGRHAPTTIVLAVPPKR